MFLKNVKFQNNLCYNRQASDFYKGAVLIVADARLLRLSAQFLVKNYDYLWLKTMLHKARTDTSPNPKPSSFISV